MPPRVHFYLIAMLLCMFMAGLMLTGCGPTRYIFIDTELPPPPPRVYGEPLTEEEYDALPATIREKFKAGIKLHRDREELMEKSICSTRPKPCP